MSGKRKKGFSLFEMLLVVAMIGLISTAAVPVAELMFIKTKENELEANLAQIRQAIKLYKRDCRNVILKQLQKGYGDLHKVPDSEFYPRSLISLMNPSILIGGKHSINDPQGGTVDFYPKPYLNSIPVDPFVGAATWKVHYASGTTPTIFEGGDIVGPIPADHVGILDVSPVDNTGNRRRGFVQAIDGTNYTDW